MSNLYMKGWSLDPVTVEEMALVQGSFGLVFGQEPIKEPEAKASTNTSNKSEAEAVPVAG